MSGSDFETQEEMEEELERRLKKIADLLPDVLHLAFCPLSTGDR